MLGNVKVIKFLNELLGEELAAIDQYFIHSRMYQNWGYQKLFERANHEVSDEQQHATLLIQRILFLDGTPSMNARAATTIGKSVPEMLQNDLNLEMRVLKHLRLAIACCEEEQDYATRKLLVQLLIDTEEDHTLWLEQQLGLIKKLGLEHYLATTL
jgi:bacterioferritin